MKASNNRRFVFILFLSWIIIACSVFQPSNNIARLQSTIDILITQLEPSEQEEGSDTISMTATPVLLADATPDLKPEITPTETSYENAYELIGQYGGSSIAVAVRDKTALFGLGPRLIVMDVSNPTSPTQISRSELLPGIVQGVAIDGDHAFVTARYGGLHIFNISQLESLDLINTVQPQQPGCGPIVLEEGIAYIACNSSGLFIVDVNDPVNPSVLSSDHFSGPLVSIAKYEKFIFLSNAFAKNVNIIDVSNPEEPQQVGVFDSATIPSLSEVFIQALDICNGHLCLAVANHGLAILDLADPTNPTLVGNQTQFWPSGVISSGQYAYVLDDLEGVRVFDITNPSQPQQVGLMPTTIGGFEFTVQQITERGLFITEDMLYIADPTYGLIMVDVSEPANPTRVGALMSPAPDTLINIKIHEGLAYLVSITGGFRILDISDPENMNELYFDDERKNITTQVPSGVEIVHSYALISDRNIPLRVYDVSTPHQAAQVRMVTGGETSLTGEDLLVWGNYAYLSGCGKHDRNYPGSGICVIDISNPANPQPLQVVDLPNEHWFLSIKGQTLYALDGMVSQQDPEPLSLRILDISNPALPQLIKSIPIPALQTGIRTRTGICVNGDRLYIGTGMGGLKVYDITSPFDPVEIFVPAFSTLSPYASALSTADSILFINGNMAIDISDPDDPKLLAMATEAIEAWDCDQAGDLVFIATSFHGVYAYQLNISD